MPDNYVTQSFALSPDEIQIIRNKAHAMDVFSRSEALRAIIREWADGKIPVVGTIDSETGKIEFSQAKKVVAVQHADGSREIDPEFER